MEVRPPQEGPAEALGGTSPPKGGAIASSLVDGKKKKTRTRRGGSGGGGAVAAAGGGGGGEGDTATVRPPRTEAERQFEEAAVEVMCRGQLEAQHAFLLLHPRLLPASSSPRRPTRRLFQIWLREMNAAVESNKSPQPSAEDLLKRQSLLSFMQTWVKNFQGDLSASRCSTALKAISLALSPPSSSSVPSASPARRPSLVDQQRKQLNEFKLLFLQHRKPTKSSSLEARASASPPGSPSMTPRASVNLSSSPTSGHMIAGSLIIPSSPSPLHSSISTLSPRSRHSSAILPSTLDEHSVYSPAIQSRSADLPAVNAEGKTSRNDQLHRSDESDRYRATSPTPENQPRTSPRKSDKLSGSEEERHSPRGDANTSAADENAQHSPRKRSNRPGHVRSDSMGAILSVSHIRSGQPTTGGRRTPRLRFLDIPLDVLAEEMTAQEIRMMYAVHPREFIGQGWQKSVELNLAPNITALINRFNHVSFWATTEVLMKDSPQLMANTIKRLIKLAWKFYVLNNFNAVAEIVSGLNSAAIQRLSVWRDVPDKYARRFKELDTLVQIKQNYRNYRERIAEILPPESSPTSSPGVPSSPLASNQAGSLTVNSLTSSSSVILSSSSPLLKRTLGSGRMVPYFAVLLRDITFAMIGNPLYVPPVKVVSPIAERRKPVRRLSESDADDAKEEEAQEEEELRGGELPITGGSVNMDRLMVMFEQVQTFERMRREMKSYEFLDRKREKEDKEHARRLIREFQAELPAIANADMLYDLSLAAEGNASLPSAGRSSRRSLASSIESPALSLWSSSPPDITRPASTSFRPVPSLVSSISMAAIPTSSLSSSASTTVLSPRSRSIMPSSSLSPPLSPSTLSSTSAIYVRTSSGHLRTRRASDDGTTTAAFVHTLADGGSDDEGSEDERTDSSQPLSKEKDQPATTEPNVAEPTVTEKPKRKTRLRRKDVESIRRVVSSPDGTDEDKASDMQQSASKTNDTAARRNRRSIVRRSSGALPASTTSLTDIYPDIAEVAESLSASSTASTNSRGGSRRAFTYRRASANASEGDLVAKVVVEVRSFVGNAYRPVLLTFRDSLEQFLAKAMLRHESMAVVSFVYEAPNSCSSDSSALPGSASSPREVESKETGRRVTVTDDEGFDTFKRWALHQRERATIDIWLIAAVY